MIHHGSRKGRALKVMANVGVCVLAGGETDVKKASGAVSGQTAPEAQ